MRRPNHASRFEGIAKTNLQASSASDTETLQSQVDKAGKKRLSLSGLEILHGRQRSLMGGVRANERLLERLEAENTQLRRRVVELALQIQALRDDARAQTAQSANPYATAC